ncbi:MAG: DNA damage-inducible protein D [Terracidiphilus sp.]|jgi:DNA-damage-inducible protein D
MPDPANIVIERLKSLQKTSRNGYPFWMAKEIMNVLDYREWRDFKQVIERAKASCENSGNFIANHFVLMPEMMEIGKGARREVENFALSKFACYLVAMNGETSKPEIAAAQAYFVEQTYRQETEELLSEAERRLLVRNRVKDANKKLGGAAKQAGVTNRMFGVFHDAGYQGLYGGLGVAEIKKKKRISEGDELLDCMGRAELAANEFRITQTEEKLRIEAIKGEQRAIDTHRAVGKKVRQTMIEMKTTLPENLRPEPSIKNLAAAKAREAKRLQSKNASR